MMMFGTLGDGLAGTAGGDPQAASKKTRREKERSLCISEMDADRMDLSLTVIGLPA